MATKRKAAKTKTNMIASVMEAATADVATDNIVATEANNELESKVDVPETEADTNSIADDLTEKQLDMPTSAIQYDDTCNITDEIKRLNAENSELKDKIAEYITEKVKLEQNAAYLQNEYDNALIKISELSFEVAQLKASLDEISKSNINVNASNKNNSPSQSMNVPYQAYADNNGYSSWN